MKIYSSVARLPTVKTAILLNVAKKLLYTPAKSSLPLSTAFLGGKFKSNVYIKTADGCEKHMGLCKNLTRP